MNVPQTPPLPLLELDLLKTLVAIAETGNFSTAAEAVLRTPSAVSMQVKKMEELLGRPLFVRDSRSVRLTGDGEMILEHARRLLALNREIVSRFVAPEVAGEVRLGAPDDVVETYLPQMLCRFGQTHPGVTVNVVVDQSARMVEMVEDRRLDLAIVTRCTGDGGAEAGELLLEEPLVWGVLRGGVAAEQDPLPVSVWEAGCAWRNAGLSALEAAGRSYRIAFESTHISGQCAAILADLAVAPISRTSLGGDIVEAGPATGLPPLPNHALGLRIREAPSTPVRAAADHLRASFARCC